MNGVESEQPEDSLADALAAYDDRLADGIDKATEPTEPAVDPALLPEWNRLTAFLSLLEKAWPRTHPETNRPADPQSTDPGSFTESGLAPPEVRDDRCFGRFQIQRTLGQGGFGIVFLAWDPTLRRQVAIKVPQPETFLTLEARKRFQREGLAAAGLDHPNIVPVYECGSVGSVTYIAAAYIPGPTLALWRSNQTQPVPARDAAQLVASLARAVEHAHQRGVLHRDLKPSNILLQGPLESNDHDDIKSDSLADFVPRITDFSLAKLADGLVPDTKSGVPFGSPPYMAPEQAEGKLSAIGPPTDVYGLGSILYEVLTTHPPFMGQGQLDTLRLVIADDPLPPRRLRSDLPSDLESVVLKCLKKDPARRYSSAGALADDLDRYLASEPTHARPPGLWEKLARKARRHPAAVAMLTIVAACLVILLMGSRWYEDRLQTDRQNLLQNAAETRAQQATNERYLQYVMHIREADRLIAEYKTPIALKILDQERPRPGEPDLREFSWYYLRQRCHTERRTLTGHQGDVHHVEFSRRGDLLASAGKDGTVRLWNTTTWEPLPTIQASDKEVNAAAFSPDGQTLATVDDEGKLKLWETAAGHLRLERLAHNGDAVVARFTPDGNTVITGGRNDGFIRLWDRRTGVMRDSFQAGRSGLENAAISPDGSILATVGAQTIKLWNLSDRTLLATLGTGLSAQGVAFSHDGAKLATVDEGDRLVRLWDITTRSLLHEFTGHTDGVFAVAFSTNDRTLISASADSTILFWDVTTDTKVGVHSGHTGRVWNLALSPDGRTIASAGKDGSVKLWSSRPSPDHFRLPASNPVCFELLDDGRTIMTLESGDPWQVGRWDVHSGSLLERKPIRLNREYPYASFSRNGRWLTLWDRDGRLTLWNIATGKRQDILDPKPENVRLSSFSPDSQFLAFFRDARRGQYSLLDLESHGEILFPCEKVFGPIFTPSSGIIALLVDGSVCRWDPRTGRSRRSPSVHPYALRGFRAISADGRVLASANLETHTIYLHSAETLELIKELPAQLPSVGPLAFSPDGKTLASSVGDRTVKLWDIKTGEELLSLGGYSGWTSGIAFSSDGHVLASISQGGPQKSNEIFLWGTAEVEPQADQSPSINSPP